MREAAGVRTAEWGGEGGGEGEGGELGREVTHSAAAVCFTRRKHHRPGIAPNSCSLNSCSLWCACNQAGLPARISCALS